jgi:hypothetical protein
VTVHRAIPAESTALTDDDVRKRDLVKELIQAQNQRLVDFAKHLLTVSFSAIGVILAFKEKWLPEGAPSHHKVLLGIAVALFLVTAILSTLAASTYVHRVSLSDYAEVDVELQRVATRRYWLTQFAFGISVIAMVLVALVVLWT